MTLVTGGELFTGNTALGFAAYKEGKITGGELMKSWVGLLFSCFWFSRTLAGIRSRIVSFSINFFKGIELCW
jgi:formate/nitrite transporter FocA (FNT family)